MGLLRSGGVSRHRAATVIILAVTIWVTAHIVPRDTLSSIRDAGSPSATREAIVDALERAGRNADVDRAALEEARMLARRYAAAWQDSFWVRQVDRFAAMSRGQRLSKRRGDSLRVAGVEVFSQRGPAAAIRLWRQAVAASRAAGDTSAMAGALDNISAALMRLDRLDSASVYLSRARVLVRAVGDLRVEANIAGHQADLSADRGDFARARRQYFEAIALRQKIGDSRGIAADHNNLGLIAQGLGDLAEAESRFETALALNRAENRAEAAATNIANLAELASLRGDFTVAGSHYRDALAAWREAGDVAETAFALFGLGQLELRRGNYAAARKFLTEALRAYEATGAPDDVIAARQALADALGASGNLQGAIHQIDAALRYADSAHLQPATSARLALAEADLLMRLNELSKAERRYKDAQRLYRSAGDARGHAEALHGLGMLALEKEDPAAAQSYLSAALRTQEASGDTRAAAITRIALGGAAAGRGDLASARRLYARAARQLDSLQDPVAAAVALGERASIEAASGNNALAQTLYRQGLRRLDQRPAADVSWRLHAGLGTALRISGARDAAAREFRQAITTAEAEGASLRLPQRRSAFLADKREVYAELARLEAERGMAGAAFEAAERLRARETMDLLDHGRVATVTAEPASLISREQDLRRQVSDLTKRINTVIDPRERRRGPDVARTGAALREQLLKTQEQYSDLLLRLRERAPEYAMAVSGRVASWRDVSRRLQSNQAFVTYLLTDSGSLALVVVRDSVVSLDLGVTRREIARLVDFTRGVLDERTGAGWRGPLRRLHAHLIAPIEDAGLLEGKQRITIVPHAELHYAPFAAFISAGTGEQFLSQRYELSFAPSASVWLTVDEQQRPATRGVLAFAPRTDALPGTANEVAAIKSMMPEVLAATGRDASEHAFRREAPGKRIVHLASFGVLNKQNPLFSFVELAAGGEHDGVLEVNEVFGLDISADLVVLSACQTALGSGARADIPPGDDWVGLTRAFLLAGARQVLGTLWPVDDWATATFMKHFYGNLARGMTPERAVSVTQRLMAASTATSDPFYWAGFVLVGGPESRRP
jgi:CHAT domain-containing protein/tetratricopeptide (TPR) repeat protein